MKLSSNQQNRRTSVRQRECCLCLSNNRGLAFRVRIMFNTFFLGCSRKPDMIAGLFLWIFHAFCQGVDIKHIPDIARLQVTQPGERKLALQYCWHSLKIFFLQLSHYFMPKIQISIFHIGGSNSGYPFINFPEQP